MSTYVLMRILESAPHRYDLGIRLLTLGRVDRARAHLVRHINPGQQVLDLGCGTGAAALLAAQRGAEVKGIDVNPQMLEIAEARLKDAGLAARVRFVEMGVAELDREAAERYDAVTSVLCLSELSGDELAFTLKHAARVLKPGGFLLIADEVRPEAPAIRVLHALLRAPLAGLTYLLTQQTTHPMTDLSERLVNAGFSIESIQLSGLQSFAEVVARRPTRMAR